MPALLDTPVKQAQTQSQPCLRQVTVETSPTAQRLILTLAAKRSSGLCSFPEVQCCHLKEDEQRFLSSLGQHLHKAIDAAQLFRRQLRRR